MKIIQITDLHLNESSQKQAGLDPYAPPIDTNKSFESVKNEIKKDNTSDFILVTGDIAQEPTDKAYQRIKALLQDFKTPCYCLSGNHDDTTKLRKHCNQDQLYTINQLDKNGWRIIFLDTSKPECVDGHLSPTQLNHLKAQLDTQLHVLIAMHHPPVPIHSKWMDQLGLQEPESFLQVINDSTQVKAVVFGHIHQEFDEIHNHVRFLGTPSTCTQFVKEMDNFMISDLSPAYRKIHLEENGLIKTSVHYIQ